MPIRVAIVDDHPMVAEGIQAILESYDDIDVVATCSSGPEILAQVKKLAADVILLDLNMPRMDGRAALEEIRKDPALMAIPIVVLTTSKSEEDILRTYNLGVNSFITKPVSFDGLVHVVQILNKYWIEIVALPNTQ